MSKYIFDLEDGENYWLVGPQGALFFNTEDDEGINISTAGLGAICKLERYEEEAKMIRNCCVCVNSYEEAEKVLEKLEKMYPDMLWDNGYKPTAFIPKYNQFYIAILNGELSYSTCPVMAIDDELTFSMFMAYLCNEEVLRENRRETIDARDEVMPKEQSAKSDAGKPKLTLVPQQIIWDIAEVREYGNKKYGDPDNWKTVEKERYRDAAFRHMLQYLADPSGVDEESKLPHLWHLATNCAFLCELEKDEYDIQRNKKTVKKE